MKMISGSVGALLLAVLSLADAACAGLTVHEWGTLTVLSDADGQQLRWYLPVLNQQELPEYVYPGFLIHGAAAKSGGSDGLAVCRMETPVLYFYPDKAMNIIVSAGMNDGRITDWFPDALRSSTPAPAAPGFKRNVSAPRQVQWIGRLVPPNAPEASTLPNTSDDAGRHYAAARAVPDAWIFCSGLPAPEARWNIDLKANPPDVKPMPPYAENDRVIFYRGASNSGGPLHVSTGDDRTFTLRNQASDSIPVCFGVQVTADGVAWTRVDGLQPSRWEEARWSNTKNFTFPASVERARAVEELGTAVRETLVTEGLTPAEAAAMVATWRDLWFTEPGTRVLTVLPESWVHTLVPLRIEPAPEKLDRVYVLRSEILTKSRTETLAEVISTAGDPAPAAARLKTLELGRFSMGALTAANQLVTRRNEARFYSLQK